jgi:ABC-type multidrug transport system fused ATPase/permease subunit
MLGLLQPSEGAIEVDGVSLQSLQLPAWRQLIGYVPQEGFLLNASVYENIVFLRDGIDEAHVELAARQANIHDFICSLPSGYHTPVGENGVALSAGERQRVCLARALAGDPQILILDEATSSLDSQVEKLILDAIRHLRQSRTITIVVIAHRLSTIEDADRIIVLDKGRLVEMGTKTELLLRPDGVFRTLYAIQNPSLTVVDLEAL